MEIKKISEKENPLFSRKEIHFEMKSDSVPSYDDFVKVVHEKFSFKPELMRIQKIGGKYGTKVFDAYVHLYDSKKEFERIVKKTKQEKEKEKKASEENVKAEAEVKKAEKEAKKAGARKSDEEKVEESK